MGYFSKFKKRLENEYFEMPRTLRSIYNLPELIQAQFTKCDLSLIAPKFSENIETAACRTNRFFFFLFFRQYQEYSTEERVFTCITVSAMKHKSEFNRMLYVLVVVALIFLIFSLLIRPVGGQYASDTVKCTFLMSYFLVLFD